MRYSLLAFAAAALLSLGSGTITAQGAGPQYQYQYAQTSDVQLIASYYQRYLGRQPDAVGLQGWVQEYRRGRNVEAAILGSDEYFQQRGSTAEGFVVGLYMDVLGRRPAYQEVEGWLQRLQQQGFNREALAAEFLNAAAFELSTRGVQQVQPVTPPVYSGPGSYRTVLPIRAWFHIRH